MITKELVAQWVSAVADPDKVQPYQNGFWTLTTEEMQAFAALAAAHGAAQRDAELMGAGMHPAYYWEPTEDFKDTGVAGWSTNTGPAPGWKITHYYTATQLAAARLQGAEDERLRAQGDYDLGFARGLEASASFKEEAKAYKEAYFKLTENVASMKVFEPIPPILISIQGERVNQVMLALLRRYRTETPLGHQPHMIAEQADAAIAAAEKETAWHQDGTTDSAKTTTASSVRGLQTGSEQEKNCARCGAELMSDMTTICYQCNQE